MLPTISEILKDIPVPDPYFLWVFPVLCLCHMDASGFHPARIACRPCTGRRLKLGCPLVVCSFFPAAVLGPLGPAHGSRCDAPSMFGRVFVDADPHALQPPRITPTTPRVSRPQFSVSPPSLVSTTDDTVASEPQRRPETPVRVSSAPRAR